MKLLYGREKIKTDILDVNRDNVVDILRDAMQVHDKNRKQEDALWDIYRGKMDVLSKTKEFREDINNIIIENRALQTTEFYQGYIFGEPIQYIRSGDQSLTDEITWLNGIMAQKDKTSSDDELAEWLLVCGVCPRMVLPNKTEIFDIYTLDPRYAFNIYHNGLGEPVVMSVKYVVKGDDTNVFSVYTNDKYFELEGESITKEERHILGEPPMIEYCLNNIRLGIFEPVVSIIDAINMLQSSRLDDVQQFVNSILAIVGAEISEDTLKKLQEWGALNLPEGTDAKYLTAALSQGDIQTLKKDLLAALTEITGMPNRNGGSSTSDTGSAVLLRDGWEIADAKSKRIEVQFKKAERKMLKKILDSAATLAGKKLSVNAIDIRFTRRNYEGILVKSQVLNTMLNNEKIHPELAFTHSGMFADPLSAYDISAKHYKEVKEYEGDDRKKTAAGNGGNPEGSAGKED